MYPKKQNVGTSPPPHKTGKNIIGFYWPTILFKGLQKIMFVPNLNKIGQELRFAERRYIYIICIV